MSKLTCIHGLNKGDEFPVHEGKNVIGRASDAGIVLFDKKCSRNHCMIVKKGNHYSIADCDSTNGTKLNGKTIGSNAKTCKFGDKIRIGKTVLILSDKAIGNFVQQTASDVAADLQKRKYGTLLSAAAVGVQRSHNDHNEDHHGGGFVAKLKSLLQKRVW
ncbi:MAG: FHA domain-containing protein [Candidatus Pacebacteria bacterium]|nr:FHA domain-containing protein [Candidatus Paceibacterota bacterium]